MTARNAYATVTQLKAFMPNSSNIDTATAELDLEAASREFDKQSGRIFYPTIKTNLYDTPKKNHLVFHDDLLEMLTFTNGDGTEIESTNYKLWPYNSTPKYQIELRPLSSVYFEFSSTYSSMAAISALAIWGYHERYDLAWSTGSTLSAAIATTSATSVTITSETLFAAGQIIRIDDELLLVDTVTTLTHTLTFQRGWNGSTAATHDNGATVTIWTPEPMATKGVLIQTARLYNRKDTPLGSTGGGEMGVQPVVLSKLDPDVQRMAESFRSRF